MEDAHYIETLLRELIVVNGRSKMVIIRLSQYHQPQGIALQLSYLGDP